MWRRVVAASAAVMVLCVLAFVGSIMWRAFGGDHDKYGRIAIPGEATVTLPAGEVDVCFAATLTTSGSGAALTVPSMSFDVRPPEGAPDPQVREDLGGSVSINNAAHVRVWRMDVPRAGTYTITTDGEVQGYIAPQLTFGTGSRAPTWPILASGALFFVALGLLVVGVAAGGHSRSRPVLGSQVPAPSAAYTPTPPGVVPYSGAPTLPPASTRTPEQEMDRLHQLQQLADLRARGTVSEAEYDAARRRLDG